jgi:hypothetical protein
VKAWYREARAINLRLPDRLPLNITCAACLIAVLLLLFKNISCQFSRKWQGEVKDISIQQPDMGEFRHDSRNRPPTPDSIEGHGIAVDYNSDNPNSPTYSPLSAVISYHSMADPIDSAL